MSRNDLQRIATLTPEALPASLSAGQGHALAALLAGRTITSAAQAAGVNRTTVWRWLHQDAEFMAFHNSARSEMDAAVQQSLRLLSATAALTLKRLMTRKSVPDAVKLTAALAVLKLGTAPVAGPTEPEDARNEVLKAARRQELESRMARKGVTDADIERHLRRPISKEELEEFAELHDDLDDDDPSWPPTLARGEAHPPHRG